MLNRLVELSLRYKFLVLIGFTVVAFLGLQAVRDVPIDAFPDLTPAQVNIYTESPGVAAEDFDMLAHDAQHHIKSLIGVTADVAVLAPGALPRSQGKAVRVRDLRKQSSLT